DTKRVPYGDKSREEIELFAGQIINFMIEKNVKAIVIACNTTCAVINKEKYKIKLFDVLKAGARSGILATRNKKVGVIATARTVESKSYEYAIKALDPVIEVYQKACPQFVPLIEEGLYNSILAYEAAKECLRDFNEYGIDTLILGCTHYPLMIEVINRVIGVGIKLIDPAIGLSQEILEYVKERGMENPTGGKIEFFVSGDEKNFKTIAKRLLGREIDEVFTVDIEKY
ncbi:MAG: glutamate racemase, partial [Caldanaerobacter sp.]